MNSPRTHKILADLIGNPARSLLVVASITIGLFAIGVITTLHIVLSTDMAAGYATVNPANIRLRAGPLTPKIIDHMSRLDGVSQAEGTRSWNARLELAPNEWTQVEFHAIPDSADQQIDTLDVLRGSWPLQRRQVAIDRYKLADTRADVGDILRIEMPSGAIQEVELAAVVQDQTIGDGGMAAGFFVAPVQAYVDMDTAPWLGQPARSNELQLTVSQHSDDIDHLWEIGEKARQELEDMGLEVTSLSVRRPQDHPNRPFVDAVVVVLVMLGALILFLSAFLITNTLQALLAQQQEQIGVLKTLGASRMQVVTLYMGLILMFGLLALALAAPLANLVAFELADFLSTEINFQLQGRRIVPLALAIEASLALLVPQIAGAVPIWRGSAVSVREALSGFRLGKMPSLDWFSQQLLKLRGLSRPIVISLRNVFRNRGRMLLTLTTLALGGAMFIATFNVRVSMLEHTDNIARYFLADVNISTSWPQRVEEVERIVNQLPGVDRVEGWAAASGELVLPDGTIGDGVSLLGTPTDSDLVQPILTAGRWIQPGDEAKITLNEPFQQRLPDLKVGDTVTIQIDGEDEEWTVVGFYQMAGSSGGFLGYTSYDYLSDLTGRPRRATQFRVVANQENLTLGQQEELGRRVEAALEAQGVEVREMHGGAWLSEISAEGFAIVTAFLLFMSVLTALVGSIGLTGSLSLNVMERTREIGVMRAIGASNRILIRMVLVEGMTMGFLSWLAGSLLALPFSKLMADSVSLALFDTASSFNLTYVGFGLWMLTVGLLSSVASLLPALSASRLTIREVLAYE